MQRGSAGAGLPHHHRLRAAGRWHEGTQLSCCVWACLGQCVALQGSPRRQWMAVGEEDTSAAVGRAQATSPRRCGRLSMLCAACAFTPASLPNAALAPICGASLQDDVLFYNLTVRETLEFAAKMRLPSSVPAAAKSELVSEIIAELGLAKAQNTFIGNSFVRGISGGERKRVCIALEILSNPSLIFLDEPTSGMEHEGQNSMK